MVVIRGISWNNWSIEHISRHGVSPEEVEEVCFENEPYIRKGRDGTYYILGQTLAGRYLFIVAVRSGEGMLRIITARDMDSKERRLYREQGGR